MSSLVTWLIILFVRFCQEYSQGVAGAVFWFDMTIDDWVVKNVPIGRSGLCWIYQQLLHHPIHLKAGNIQLSKNSFFSVLSQTKRMSVGKSESVNNVLEPESIVVPVNTVWSLSYFCYSKCKVAFILRALEGIISHFTGEIVSARLPITDANKTQQSICQNICIALKWWKLERLSDTGAWYYPVQGCHDWQSPSKESGKMKKEGLG